MPQDPTDTLQQSEEIGSRKLTRITATPDGTPLFYTNNASFRTSFWDFTMDFGQLLEASETDLVVKDMVSIVMSPQHAVAFAETLALQLEGYERQFGPITRIPRVDQLVEEDPHEDQSGPPY